jgi:16S rRNA (guanine966-N2)-methyltransferase
MRIIAGRFRRRQLLTNAGLVTRPITDRVKESLFERLDPLIEESRVADIFAGTGSLGLEALSRGAKSVVFIENDRKAFDLLKQNVAKLGVADDVLCWQTDAMRSSYRPKGCPDFVPFDLIFFDPPYRFVEETSRARTISDCLNRLARADVSSSDARPVLRTSERADFTLPATWSKVREFQLSGMRLVLAAKKEGTADQEAGDPA